MYDAKCPLNDWLEVEMKEVCEGCNVDGEYDDTYGRKAPSVDARTVLWARCL